MDAERSTMRQRFAKDFAKDFTEPPDPNAPHNEGCYAWARNGCAQGFELLTDGMNGGGYEYGFFVGIHQDSTTEALALLFTWGQIMIYGEQLAPLRRRFLQRKVERIQPGTAKDGLTIRKIEVTSN